MRVMQELIGAYLEHEASKEVYADLKSMMSSTIELSSILTDLTISHKYSQEYYNI